MPALNSIKEIASNEKLPFRNFQLSAGHGPSRLAVPLCGRIPAVHEHLERK